MTDIAQKLAEKYKLGFWLLRQDTQTKDAAVMEFYTTPAGGHAARLAKSWHEKHKANQLAPVLATPDEVKLWDALCAAERENRALRERITTLEQALKIIEQRQHEECCLSCARCIATRALADGKTP